jgi:hypothetical protein
VTGPLESNVTLLSFYGGNVTLLSNDPAAAVPMVLVQPSPAPEDPGGRGPDAGKSSPVGFLVLLVFFIAVAFLIRSMTKHLKRVPASFGEEPDNGETPAKAEPAK